MKVVARSMKVKGRARGGPDAAVGVWVPWHKRLSANRVAELFPLVALRAGYSKPRSGHPAELVVEDADHSPTLLTP